MYKMVFKVQFKVPENGYDASLLFTYETEYISYKKVVMIDINFIANKDLVKSWVLLADGNYFGKYGSGLLANMNYFDKYRPEDIFCMSHKFPGFVSVKPLPCDELEIRIPFNEMKESLEKVRDLLLLLLERFKKQYKKLYTKEYEFDIKNFKETLI
jgi:hypothetical protein